MAKQEKPKSFAEAVKALEDQGISVIKVADDPKLSLSKIPVIPSGSLGLNYALGAGGYPRGSIVELFGNPQGGKTMLASLAIAEAQKLGGTAVVLDLEHSFNKQYASDLGVKVDDVNITYPKVGEDVFTIIENMVAHVDILVVDSTAAMIPLAEREADIKDVQMGMHARLMSKGLRRIMDPVGNSNAVVIFINQLRTNLQIKYGDPNITTGGKGLSFYAVQRVSVSRPGGEDFIYRDGFDQVVGGRVRAKVVKNKVGMPLRECEFDLYFNRGVDQLSELPHLAWVTQVVTLEGKTYKYGDRKWVGMPDFERAVKKDPELAKQLLDEILSKVNA